MNLGTPKEEAKELVYRFLKEFPSTDDIGFGQIKIAKQCALICVNQSIESLRRVGHSFCNDEIEYLKEVKLEIRML